MDCKSKHAESATGTMHPASEQCCTKALQLPLVCSAATFPTIQHANLPRVRATHILRGSSTKPIADPLPVLVDSATEGGNPPWDMQALSPPRSTGTLGVSDVSSRFGSVRTHETIMMSRSLPCTPEQIRITSKQYPQITCRFVFAHLIAIDCINID